MNESHGVVTKQKVTHHLKIEFNRRIYLKEKFDSNPLAYDYGITANMCFSEETRSHRTGNQQAKTSYERQPCRALLITSAM